MHVGLGIEIFEKIRQGEEGLRFSYRHDPTVLLRESLLQKLIRILLITPFNYFRCRPSEHSLVVMLKRIHSIREVNGAERPCRSLDSVYAKYVHSKVEQVDLAQTFDKKIV